MDIIIFIFFEMDIIILFKNIVQSYQILFYLFSVHLGVVVSLVGLFQQQVLLLTRCLCALPLPFCC